MAYTIIFSLTWSILHNLFVVKREKLRTKNNFSHIDIDCVCLIVDAAQQLRAKKLLHYYQQSIWKVTIDAPPCSFVVLMKSCVLSNPTTTTFHREYTP